MISVSALNIEQAFQQEYLDYSDFDVNAYDGLLIPGGGDINPSRYGEENQGSVYIMDELDDLQLSILDAFVKQRKPVFGICRGHQLLNVYFGGSLIQHLPTYQRHSKMGGQDDKVHGCVAVKNSWLEKHFGEVFPHNSAHHQAVRQLGEGLVIDSRCLEDGTVEGMHHTTLPIIGVQWHPERTCLDWEREDTVNGLALFRYFNRMCMEYMIWHTEVGALDQVVYTEDDLWV